MRSYNTVSTRKLVFKPILNISAASNLSPRQDKIKILYPKLQNAAVQAAIKAVFDGINGGANVNFEDLGPVIDEIVIQMGGHDPSKYLWPKTSRPSLESILVVKLINKLGFKQCKQVDECVVCLPGGNNICSVHR